MLGTDSQKTAFKQVQIQTHLTGRQIADRTETVSYPETEDTWRGVENSYLGSLFKFKKTHVLDLFVNMTPMHLGASEMSSTALNLCGVIEAEKEPSKSQGPCV